MELKFYIVCYIVLTLIVRMMMFVSIENGDDIPLIGDISEWPRPRRIAVLPGRILSVADMGSCHFCRRHSSDTVYDDLFDVQMKVEG